MLLEESVGQSVSIAADTYKRYIVLKRNVAI